MKRAQSFGKRPDTKRRVPQRSPRRRILLVCEGARTEYNYFEEIRRALRRSALEIEVRGLGQDPKSLVQRAKELKRKSRDTPYDSIWCVFDRDEHSTWHEALDMARANKIHVACSVPCFELWYFLHFKRHHTHLDRSEALRCVGQCLQGYEKNMPDLYARLAKRLPVAMENALFLREEFHPKTGNPPHSNPWTNVDELVQELLEQP